MERSAGSMLAGRYRIERELGRGGMGTVWLAEDQVIARKVAIKLIEAPQDPAAADLLDRRRRALREARAAGRLSHPQAVTVFDVIEEPGRCAIVMELVDAPTLADLVRSQGPVPPDRLAGLGLQLVEVLEAAHRAGIVHRDVKPGNVMVLPGDRVKLADFGIASLHGDPQLTVSGMAFGSPRYMSPEQAAGLPAGPASDWWSLGATLYFAVEGRPPFERDGTPALLAAILTQEPDPMVLAGRLRPAIDVLLAREPDDRPTPAVLRRLLRPAPAAGATGEPAGATGVASQQPFAPGRESPTETALPTVAAAAASPTTAAAAPPSRRAVLMLGGLSAGLAVTSVALGAVLLRGRDGGDGDGAGPAASTGSRPTAGAGETTGAGGPTQPAPSGSGQTATAGQAGATGDAGQLAAADAPSTGLGAGSAGRPGLQEVALSAAAVPGQRLPQYVKAGRNDVGGHAFGAEPLWVASTAGSTTFVELESAFGAAFEVRVFAAGDPFVRVKQDEARFAQEHAADSYRRLGLTDRWDYAGRPAASWEFTWTRRGEPAHGRLVAFTAGTRTFTVLFRCADRWWGSGAIGINTDNFEQAFHPLP